MHALHTYICAAQVEFCNSLQKAMDAYGLQYDQVHQYLQIWTWPCTCTSAAP